MNILVGIATINSYKYIDKTIQVVLQEIALCNVKYNFTIFISVNGCSDTYKFLQGKYQTSDIIIFYDEKAGKNNALNKIINYAKVNDFQIIHFFDDDIKLHLGTLNVNVNQLVENYNNSVKHQIVASTVFCNEYNFNFFYRKYGLFTCFLRYYYYSIFSLPWITQTPKPNFVIGMSYGVLTRDIGEFPNDNTGIADDGYVGNDFIVNNIQQVKNGFKPIIFPKDSKVFFNVSTFKNEWLKQQTRIHLGVMRSYYYFKDSDFLRDYFAWEYSHDQLKPISFHQTLKHRILFFFYIKYILQMKKIAKHFSKTEDILWNTATSTKENL